MAINFQLYSMYHNTDLNTIGITSPIGLVAEEYPVGVNFLEYLNLDFNSYNEFYKLYKEYYKESLLNKPKNLKDKENSFIDSCKNIYSLWVDEIADEIKCRREELNKKKTPNNDEEINILNGLSFEYEYYTNELSKINKTNSIQGLKKLNVLNNIFLRTLKLSASTKHPYIRHAQMIFERDLDIKKYQDEFKELIDFCFNKDYSTELNSLSAWERYYLWQIKKSPYNSLAVVELYEPTIECSYTILPEEDLSANTKQVIKDGELNKKTIQVLKSLRAFPVKLNHCKTPTEYALCEFHAMLDSNIKIKKCDFCGNYFILSGNYHTKYCSNCKKEAIKSARKYKVESSPILKEYEKAYKRMYARKSKGNMTTKEFSLWADEASTKRDIFNERYNSTPSEELLKEFKDLLKK